MLTPILGHQWNQMRWFHNDGQRDGASLYWGTGYFGVAANGSAVVAHHGDSFGVGHDVGIGPASVVGYIYEVIGARVWAYLPPRLV